MTIHKLLQLANGKVSTKAVRVEGRNITDDITDQWTISDTNHPLVPHDGIQTDFSFTLQGDAEAAAAVQVSFTFEQWSKDNYVLLPGMVYNGNRFEVRAMSYPPMLKDASDLGPDVPIRITGVSHLNIGEGESRLEKTTEEPATPAVGIYMPGSKQTVWIVTDQQTEQGRTGITVSENEDRSQAVITFTAPSVRQQLSKEDQAASFRTGDRVTLRVGVFVVAGDSLQSLFHSYADIRTSLSGEAELQHKLPFSTAWSILEHKYNELNWQQKLGYYSVGDCTSKYQDWQPGWVGGGMSTLPLLLLGSAVSRQRAYRSFDYVFDTQAPSGFFYGVCYDGVCSGDGFDRPDADRWHLIRKSGDLLYFLMKQFMLLEQHDINDNLVKADAETDNQHELPQRWLAGARRLADAFVGLWERYGQFGQFVDVENGDILVGNSTSGGIIPAGLALAARFFDDPRYLQTAQASAQLYYDRDVLAGVTTGGPGEILQCPDSESAFGLLESFVVLYEETADRCWLDKAEQMAVQCMTWCVSYDFKWPAGAEFGRLGIRTSGSVIANVQNQHSAPGICTLSGDSLLKLFRATGNPRYIQLIQQIAHNHTQYLSRDDQPILSWENERAMPPGWVNERVNMSDWEGNAHIGGVFCGSTWAEVSLMLTIAEIPGLYVQPDRGLFYAFDHIEVTKVKQSAESNDAVNTAASAQAAGLTLSLHNPTAYEATITVLQENSSMLGTPLAQNALYNKPTITLQPGETQVVDFPVE